MRRILIIMSAALIFVLAASPVAAAGRSYHLEFTGMGAEALWSDYPAEGEPVAGTVYTDIYLSVSENAVDDNGTTFSDSFLFMDIFSYKFDRRGNWVFVSETIADAYGDALSLIVDRKLNRASVEATVTLYPCDINRDGSGTCEADGTASLSASWTGAGSLFRSNSHNHTVSPGTNFNDHFRGTFRDATTSIAMDGVEFGPQQFGTIFNSTESYIEITH